jgi:hypothetical protein
LAKALNVNKQTKVVPEIAESEPGWTQITQQFLNQLPPVSNTTAQRDSRGHSVIWALVKEEYTVRRVIVDKMLAKLSDDGLSAFSQIPFGNDFRNAPRCQFFFVSNFQLVNFPCASLIHKRQ